MACRIWATSLMKADYSPWLLFAQDSALRAANVNRVAELQFGWNKDKPRLPTLLAGHLHRNSSQQQAADKLKANLFPEGAGQSGISELAVDGGPSRPYADSR
jgi:hypothetical protein